MQNGATGTHWQDGRGALILVNELGQNVGHLGIISCKGATCYQVTFLDNEGFGERCMYNHAMVVNPTGRDQDGVCWISCRETKRHMEERHNKRLNMEKKGQACQNHAVALRQKESKSEPEDGGDDASFQPEEEAKPEEKDEKAFVVAFSIHVPEPELKVPEYIQVQAATGQGFSIVDAIYGDLIWAQD